MHHTQILLPYSLLRRKAAQKSQEYIGLEIQKAETIKANTIKSAHNTRHFSLGEQMAVHNNMHITMQNKKLTCTTV